MDDANASAVYYANKNLNDTAESADAAETETPAVTGTITNSWTNEPVTLVMEKDVKDPKKESFTTIYKDADGNYYYRVTLREEIKHLMIYGWSWIDLEDMLAKVDAVVKLSVSGTEGVPDLPDWNDGVINPEEKELLEEIKNGNVIVGNWEVQNYFIGGNYDNKILADNDTNRNKISANLIEFKGTESKKGFGFDLYTKAWNTFFDPKIHYYTIKKSWKSIGRLHRTEKINIWDDVVKQDNSSVSNNFGKSGSNVNGGTETNHPMNGASQNILDSTSYIYNPSGYPYIAEYLDSINIDFQPEANLKNDSTYPYQNWDIELGYGKGTMDYKDGEYNSHPFIGVGTVTAYQGSRYDFAAWPDHLRIHSTLNFGTPYPEREMYKNEKTHEADRDILWARIESEPMLNSPDNPDGSNATEHIFSNLKSHAGMKQFSSVRQLIITFTESNAGQNDRPVVIFYDGPEIYKKLPNTYLRESKPVIINLQADTNAIFYLPNSPVIFLPNGHNFKGFIVAKSYVRLKTEEDFRNENADNYYDELEIVDYYDKVNINADYKKILISNCDEFAVTGSKVFRRTEAVANPYYHTSPKLTGEPETINWTYTKIINPDNGIEMYVDDYGNVQYVEDADSKTPRNSGTYNTFGRTDFTTHGYSVAQESLYNMLVIEK